MFCLTVAVSVGSEVWIGEVWIGAVGLCSLGVNLGL